MSFYGVTDIWTYALGALGIILLPGPNSLFVLSVASTRGVKAGYQGAMGVFLGDSILLCLTALGAASLLHTYPAWFTLLKYLGGAYLAWIGFHLIRAAVTTGHSPVKSETTATAESSHLTSLLSKSSLHLAHPFKRALLISLVNPKAILFLLSFFVQFIDPSYDTPIVPFLILSAIIMAFSGLYLSTLIFAGVRLAQFFRQSKRLSASLSSAVGGLFIWFGAKLATASLN